MGDGPVVRHSGGSGESTQNAQPAKVRKLQQGLNFGRPRTQVRGRVVQHLGWTEGSELQQKALGARPTGLVYLPAMIPTEHLPFHRDGFDRVQEIISVGSQR